MEQVAEMLWWGFRIRARGFKAGLFPGSCRLAPSTTAGVLAAPARLWGQVGAAGWVPPTRPFYTLLSHREQVVLPVLSAFLWMQTPERCPKQILTPITSLLFIPFNRAFWCFKNNLFIWYLMLNYWHFGSMNFYNANGLSLKILFLGLPVAQ